MAPDAMLPLIGRERPLFDQDLADHGEAMNEQIAAGRFLVIGGAGSIGAAVVKQLFARGARSLHVVDISENNLAELVRDTRSSLGYATEDFRTFAIDAGEPEFDALLAEIGGYDYVLNFSALKHVRSEKDPYTLMRMVQVNIFNTDRTAGRAAATGAKKYFCVSTDKASNPVSMMGASKRIMEMYLMRRSEEIPVSSARFANVAFSDGSLPYGWTLRIRKRQPVVAPDDVRRYFVTENEGAVLCLLSTCLGGNRDIFFPKLSDKLHLIRFSEMAVKYLESLGLEPVACASEDEARSRVEELAPQRKWPVYFFKSDTSGEKDFEEFYTAEEAVDWGRFHDIGVVPNEAGYTNETLERFTREIRALRERGRWTKPELVKLFNETLSTFSHKETFRYLDDKM